MPSIRYGLHRYTFLKLFHHLPNLFLAENQTNFIIVVSLKSVVCHAIAALSTASVQLCGSGSGRGFY